MDRLEGFRERSVFEQVWFRAVRETQKLSHERVSRISRWLDLASRYSLYIRRKAEASMLAVTAQLIDVNALFEGLGTAQQCICA